MNVMFARMMGTTGFSYTTSWGESEERSETISIGTTSSVETELLPGRAATAVLSANKGALEVEVVYLTKLRGNVTVNFKIPYKGHPFWGPSIDSVMKSGGLENEVIVKDTIKLGFYTDASLGRAVSYHDRWRKDYLQNASQSFDVSRDGFINIQSGQRVTTRLKGTKTILLIKINYVARLVGYLVVKYAHVYGKYHFWAPNVNDIMKAAGIINEIITTEPIEVRCYHDPVLEIFDSLTEKPMRIVIPPTPFPLRSKSRYSNKVKKAHPK
ncbi:unnamed protein product [Parnassius apollo]|uniref:(apollo) hypothetical protein n=1 Tax=Parnassius apollo TaxID=110799 RepID=A0A8S3XH53_PARAO|nr:unnamed protein product [Parnassius apollo]